MSTQPKAEKARDIVVFSILGRSQCSECGTELGKGQLLSKEGDVVLCVSCADLDHLVFLPSGDAALTRRSSKYSTLRAVVLRFSRARKRYERQGVLIEEEALQRAERECLDDAEARALRRHREAERRADLDEGYVAAFANEVAKHYPGCPSSQQQDIAQHACQRYSGRVGRSAAAKRFAPKAIDLAVLAHVRHTHTNYDELLSTGWERLDARAAVCSQISAVAQEWKGGRAGELSR